MNPLLLSLPILLLVVSMPPAFSIRSESDPEPASLQLPLILHPSDPLQTSSTRFSNLIHHDYARHHFISSTIHRKRHPNPNCFGRTPQRPPAKSFAMPISSGAYTGTGQYFVRVRIGTPAQRFLLVADTGSDLTWVNCKYGERRSRIASGRVKRRVLDADRSRSFHPIRCSSQMCKTQLPFALATCPVDSAPCAYDYRYSGGSSTQGFFAEESATIALSNGHKRKLKGLVVGCTSSSVGSSFRSSDGVLGLGYSNISFATHATSHFGGKFSYCLVDHLSPKNTTAYLTFGSNGRLNPSTARQTQLIIEPSFEPFYLVGVDGISVDDEMLNINRSVWNLNKGGGTILDSGTSLTVLAEPAYKAVVSALSRRLKWIPRVDVDPFAFCYNWTGVGDFKAPKLIVHFDGPARLEPPAKSYLIDVESGVKCIGFVSAQWPSVSTVGNIIQQEHLWEFDVKNRKVRFQRSNCDRYS